jgi:hypothetical protein
MQKFVATSAQSESPAAAEPQLFKRETDPTRLAQGYLYSDQKNVKVQCPENAEHPTELFRSQPPTLRLFWRCELCKSKNKKFPQRLIGADNELESDGLKTVDASRQQEKESSSAAPKPVVSGHGLQWHELFADCRAIVERIERLDASIKRVHERLDRMCEKRARKADGAESGDACAAPCSDAAGGRVDQPL